MEALALAFIELPEWLTLEFIFRILDSKVFSAIYWGAAAVVAIVGFIARMKYRDRNLKRLLDAYIEKAKKADGRERQSVKKVIGRAISKARGLSARGGPAQFNPSDVFENAARFFAQRQAAVAIDMLKREAALCEAAIHHAQQQVRHARARAATAYLEIGSILREEGKGAEALDAFLDMLRVNPEDADALRMLGTQCRDLKRFGEAEQYFTTLLFQVASDKSVTSDIKRELGLVFLAGKEYPRAEAALEEALAIEKDERNQRGEALTHELIGLVRSRYRWTQARRAYSISKSIFETLRDDESADRVQSRIDLMEAGRNEELQRRREKRRASQGSAVASGDALQTLH